MMSGTPDIGGGLMGGDVWRGAVRQATPVTDAAAGWRAAVGRLERRVFLGVRIFCGWKVRKQERDAA